MSSDLYPLGHLCQIKQGKYLSPSEMSDVATQEKSIPVIGGNGILGYTNKASHTTDVALITCRGSKCGLIQWVEAPVWVSNNAMACDTGSLLGNKFLRYLFGSVSFDDVVTGSAQPQITIGHLSKKEFLVCKPEIWERIVNVLGTLDDRITLLRETNKTLEAIAQAIFKSWFIDFDPVRAKIEGRAPAGMDEETAALFPDELVESELGLVPKGWGTVKFEEFINRLSVGKKYDQKSSYPQGAVPVLDQGRSGVIGYHNDEPGVIASLDEPVVVFANHTCYMRLITFPFSAIQNVLPFKGRGVDTVWAFFATRDRQKFQEYKGHWPDFVIQKTSLPDAKLTKVFRRLIDPLIRKIRLNEMQVETLTSLRDTMLPRLISGKLRIAEDELESQT